MANAQPKNKKMATLASHVASDLGPNTNGADGWDALSEHSEPGEWKHSDAGSKKAASKESDHSSQSENIGVETIPIYSSSGKHVQVQKGCGKPSVVPNPNLNHRGGWENPEDNSCWWADAAEEDNLKQDTVFELEVVSAFSVNHFTLSVVCSIYAY